MTFRRSIRCCGRRGLGRPAADHIRPVSTRPEPLSARFDAPPTSPDPAPNSLDPPPNSVGRGVQALNMLIFMIFRCDDHLCGLQFANGAGNRETVRDEASSDNCKLQLIAANVKPVVVWRRVEGGGTAMTILDRLRLDGEAAIIAGAGAGIGAGVRLCRGQRRCAERAAPSENRRRLRPHRRGMGRLGSEAGRAGGYRARGAAAGLRSRRLHHRPDLHRRRGDVGARGVVGGRFNS